MEGIKNGVLGIGEKRMTGELVRIPQGKIPVFDAFNPEITRGNEIGSQVPFSQKKPAREEVIKE